MRIDLFKAKIEPTGGMLIDQLEHIHGLPIADRNRKVGTHPIRIEHLHRKGKFWLCDFITLRMDHGPSKAGMNTPAAGFDLDDDEGFGEETAMLWEPATNLCLVQFNHHGVRANAMGQYLSLFRHERPMRVQLLPQIDPEIHHKIRNNKYVSELEITVAPRLLKGTDFEKGDSVGMAAKTLSTTDAERINIKISGNARRGNFLGVRLPAMLAWIKKVNTSTQTSEKKDKDDGILTARATAREHEDSAAEILDLLHHRVTTDLQIQPGRDKRYSQEDRFGALLHQYHIWRHFADIEEDEPEDS